MIINNLTLNFQDKYYLFYDWLKEDKLAKYPRVYLMKISSNTLNDLRNYEISIEGELKKMPYLFTDTFSFVAIKFDAKGHSQAKSSVCLKDEERILNYADGLKYTKIKYTKLQKEEMPSDLRFNILVKSFLEKEITSLEDGKNQDKISYLYYEWFTKTEKSVDKMLKQMKEKLKGGITLKEIELYELLKLSNKVV